MSAEEARSAWTAEATPGCGVRERAFSSRFLRKIGECVVGPFIFATIWWPSRALLSYRVIAENQQGNSLYVPVGFYYMNLYYLYMVAFIR